MPDPSSLWHDGTLLWVDGTIAWTQDGGTLKCLCCDACHVFEDCDFPACIQLTLENHTAGDLSADECKSVLDGVYDLDLFSYDHHCDDLHGVDGDCWADYRGVFVVDACEDDPVQWTIGIQAILTRSKVGDTWTNTIEAGFSISGNCVYADPVWCAGGGWDASWDEAAGEGFLATFSEVLTIDSSTMECCGDPTTITVSGGC